MDIAHPPVLINHYLSEKVSEILPQYFPLGQNDQPLPFIITPVKPRNLNADPLEYYSDIWGDFMLSDKPLTTFAIYERMFKMRRGPFPHIKSEQLLYYIYVSNTNNPEEELFDISQVIQDLLDRGDESAEEINRWIANKNVNGTITFGLDTKTFKPIYFHNVKIFQLEESTDILDFATAKTYVGNKIIVEYTYHIPNDVNNDPDYSSLMS